ncbi:Protein of unknown function, partial [Gryllus bimaculatus]
AAACAAERSLRAQSPPGSAPRRPCTMRSLPALCAVALAAACVASALASPPRRSDRTGKPDVIPPRNPKLSEDDPDISRSRNPRHPDASGETKRSFTADTFQKTSHPRNNAFLKSFSKSKKLRRTGFGKAHERVSFLTRSEGGVALINTALSIQIKKCKPFPKVVPNIIVTCSNSSRKCEATCKKGYKFEDHNESTVNFFCRNGQWVNSTEREKVFPLCKRI